METCLHNEDKISLREGLTIASKFPINPTHVQTYMVSEII